MPLTRIPLYFEVCSSVRGFWSCWGLPRVEYVIIALRLNIANKPDIATKYTCCLALFGLFGTVGLEESYRYESVAQNLVLPSQAPVLLSL